jgi:hypothetical protein
MAIGRRVPPITILPAGSCFRPVAMTNGSQVIAWSAIYQPFGEVQAITAQNTTMDPRFPGQWFQLETGLHYNWHRHYDPKTPVAAAGPDGICRGAEHLRMCGR